MPTLISIILIIICLLVILTIVIKKFPALAILDVNNIPGQKETRFKENIMKARLERDLARWGNIFMKIKNLVGRRLGFFKSLHIKLKTLADHYKKSKKLSLSERQERVRILLTEADEDTKNENLNSAETKLIEIIRLDNQNLKAFRDLGDVYYLAKKYHEAKQTLEYALKLAANLKEDKAKPEINFVLAEINQDLGDLEASLNYIREALEFEANNPRYLDLLLELSIIKKDKNSAVATLAKLEEVNPENNKLEEWQNRINSL
ncbi:MAG: hypothetical protein NTX66_02125 [Candidatus Falkowbacteria bacterium]|nr:hypothetical protein [Candidatus Falkowbacteria bacterium]